MLKIYGTPKSRTLRTLWMCGEANIPHELIETAPGTNDAGYKPINPNRKVPSIDLDGYVLWESLAINFYLAKKFPSALTPQTPEDEAEVLRWSFFAATEVEPKHSTITMNRFLLPPEKRIEAAAAAAWDEVQRSYGVLESWLASRPYLCGESFTLADLNVAAVLYSTRVIPLDLSAYPRILAWLDRCLERPAAKEARRLRGGP
jgi:glutathione S-transferase